jgi:hypothetical protein
MNIVKRERGQTIDIMIRKVVMYVQIKFTL